jgi:hypothetical protein
MTVYMKPGQWDFFWDWHVEQPELTLADMLRIIREQEEAKEAEAAAEQAEETEAWNRHQEAAAAAGELATAADEQEYAAAYEGVETADPRAAVAGRLEADAAELEDRIWHLGNAARAYRQMAERLRLQMAAPAPVEVVPKPQTWMERFKAQKAAAR